MTQRVTVRRAQVLALRVHAQQLGRVRGSLADTAVLDLGVQDTGPDGSRWALALRGLDTEPADERLALAWTLRGAPHAYRREDLPAVAAAVRPWSEADAAKRVFDAAKPLRAAGIPVLDALDAVADAMRSIVTGPMVKGELSGRLTEVMPAPYRRYCRPCAAVHVYEMPFRLAALRAGLELVPDTSPPVLRPVPGFAVATEASDRLDPVRGYLHLLGPATPKQVAAFVDAPVREVLARWPEDAARVEPAAGEGFGPGPHWLLQDDLASLGAGPPRGALLLGPFDLFLQARDREVLVGGAEHRKALWPVLGRPGVVLVDGEVVGTWRPRTTGRRLRLEVDAWRDLPSRVRAEVGEQAERLAEHRGVDLTGVGGLTGV